MENGKGQMKILPVPLTSSGAARAVVADCGVPEEFRWFVNGEVIAGAATAALGNAYFRRGDKVEAVVDCGGVRVDSTTVVVNSAPVITEVTFLNPVIGAGRDLTVVAVAVDRDDDRVDLLYEWRIDEQLVAAVDGATLAAPYIDKGANIALSVTAYDGFEFGETFHGQSFTVPNSGPVITSRPPPPTAGEYVYQLSANDPDRDPLIFRLLQGPAGMTIDSATGRLEWQVPERTRKGGYAIEVAVEDSDGAVARQAFTLSFPDPEIGL